MIYGSKLVEGFPSVMSSDSVFASLVGGAMAGRMFDDMQRMDLNGRRRVLRALSTHFIVFLEFS